MNRRGLLLPGALVLTLLNGQLSAAEDARLAQVRADWRARRTAMHDVMYRIEGEVVTPKHSEFAPGEPDAPPGAENGYPPEDVSKSFKRQWSIDFDRGLFRKDVETTTFSPETLQSHALTRVEAFDGETVWTVSSNAKEDLLLQPATRMEWIITATDYPPLFAYNIFPLGTVKSAALGSQTSEQLSLRLVGEATIDGRACLVVAATARGDEVPHRLYIDPARGSAILRFESFFNFKVDGVRYGADVLAIKIDVDYRETQGLWLPSGWSYTHYAGSIAVTPGDRSESTPMRFYQAEVVELALNQGLAPALFRQPRKAGDVVSDNRDGSLNIVADDGATLVRTSRRQMDHAAPADDGSWWWGVGGGVALIVTGWLVSKFGLRR